MIPTLLCAALAAAKPAPLPLFAMDTCIRRPYPNSAATIESEFAVLRKAGFRGLSWTLADPAQTVRAADLARRQGLRIHALYIAATLTRSGLEIAPGWEETLPALKPHRAILWLHIGSKDFAPSDPAGDPIALPALRRLANAAAAHNLTVAIYPHAWEWTERTADALRLAEAIETPAVGITLNLCHALWAGDEGEIPGLIARAGSRLLAVTVNGADTNAAHAGWDRLIRPLGEGTFDLPALLSRLRVAHWNGPIGLQGFGLGGDPSANLQSAMAAWKRLAADPPR